MDSLKSLTVSLSNAAGGEEKVIGGKAAKLAQLVQAGYRVPNGFCITIDAYYQFIKAGRLDEKIKFELGRKSFDSMRWEEIWDAALRIRSAFQSAEIPAEIEAKIISALKNLNENKTLVVRSSAPKEDSAKASFAGLHESYVGVRGIEKLLNAVRLVWASLWSDAALLYQHELGLDPLHSSMAVVVQELVEENISGVAFGADPRNLESDRCIIEAVPGLCRDLVDGVLDPDRWILKRSTGDVVEAISGNREDSANTQQLLQSGDLRKIYDMLQGIEKLFGWLPDTEWTGIEDRFTLLQARPITTSEQPPIDEKSYYLSLRPGEQRLKMLAKRVAEELIPQLRQEGEQLALEDLSGLNDEQLAEKIDTRHQILQKWKKIYWDDFIPFAHGVRHLATYYNDAVRPTDPYEFVGLLKGQAMISTRRNQKLMEFARLIHDKTNLMEVLSEFIKSIDDWQKLAQKIQQRPGGDEFINEFQSFLDEYMDVSFGKERLNNQPGLVLKNVIELATGLKADFDQHAFADEKSKIVRLEDKLFQAVGDERITEAKEVLHIGRISWQLRDDDNLLLGRVESQLLRAINLGAERLQTEGRLDHDIKVNEKSSSIIAEALRDTDGGRIVLPVVKTEPSQKVKKRSNLKPRQLIGQPAAPGLISGKVRIIHHPEDLGNFKSGEILVCDAIQPNMTHLVPLAGGIVERRGGMLIHGAIIAREMGIPSVNGVPNAADILENGELVTVDGHLGIVTIGEAEFDLEKAI